MKESQFQAFLKERKAELMEEGATDIYKQVRAEWKAYMQGSRIATPHFTHKKTTGCGGRVVVVSL